MLIILNLYRESVEFSFENVIVKNKSWLYTLLGFIELPKERILLSSFLLSRNEHHGTGHILYLWQGSLACSGKLIYLPCSVFLKISADQLHDFSRGEGVYLKFATSPVSDFTTNYSKFKRLLIKLAICWRWSPALMKIFAPFLHACLEETKIETQNKRKILRYLSKIFFIRFRLSSAFWF